MLTLMLSIDDFDLDKEQLWLFKDVDQKKRNWRIEKYRTQVIQGEIDFNITC